MRSVKRLSAAAVLAIALAGLAPATPMAATNPPARITLSDACGRLADAIAFLEARPAGPLRNFLLAQARALFDRYCQ